jgi:hypothetical protein
VADHSPHHAPPVAGTVASVGASVGAPPGVSRRTLVLGSFGGVTTLALAACSSGGRAGQQPAGSGGLTPDVAVATSALEEIRAVRAAVSATIRRFPATRTSLAPLVTTHRAHEATLVDAVPQGATPSSTPAPYVVPRRREVALTRLVAREQRLHDTLDGLAQKAQSGQFARLLASMGAALGQRLTRLA